MDSKCVRVYSKQHNSKELHERSRRRQDRTLLLAMLMHIPEVHCFPTHVSEDRRHFAASLLALTNRSEGNLKRMKSLKLPVQHSTFQMISVPFEIKTSDRYGKHVKQKSALSWHTRLISIMTEPNLGCHHVPAVNR